MNTRRERQRGFVLIAMSVSMLLLLAVLGMAFDLGRIYIARNEAQICRGFERLRLRFRYNPCRPGEMAEWLKAAVC